MHEWLRRYAERWRVLAAFLALAVGSVVAFWLVVALVRSNQTRIHEGRVRDRQACQRQHFTVQMFRLFLTEGSRQFERRPVKGDGRELRAFRHRAVVLLRGADCHTVMP